MKSCYRAKTLSLFTFLSLFSSLALAASTPEFWHLSRGSQQIWILGSVHVADDSFYPLPASVEQAFKKAQRLYLEVDIAKVSALESSTAMATAMVPAGSHLKNQLTANSYKKFQGVLKEAAFPEVMFQNFKPWFAVMLLSQMKMQQLGYQADKGIDQHFSQLALKQHKPIFQFETFTQQMALLAKVEPFEQEIFDSTLEQLDDFEHLLEKMMSSWKSGNSQHLQQLLIEQSGPKKVQNWMQKTLLTERNANWFLLLEQQKPASAFIVVGALHVGGKQGLIALLKQAGFSAAMVK